MESRFEALERLAGLRERGVLTQAEFDAEKTRILGAHDAPAPVARVERSAPRPAWLWAAGGLGTALLLGGILAYAARGDIQGNRSADARPAAAGSSKAAAGVSDSRPLDTILVFASIADCVPGGELAHIVKALGELPPSGADAPPAIAMEDGGTALPVAVRRSQPKAEGPAADIAEAALKGVWQGLHVTGVRAVRWEGLPINSFEIRFRESAPDAAAALRRAGFAGLAPGKLRLSANAGTKSAAAIDVIGDGSALLCARGYPAAPADAAPDDETAEQPAATAGT
jgi:hypothetical protein